MVDTVNGTIVECSTACGGPSSETFMHYQVAEDHGFTEIADFQILDENGSVTLPLILEWLIMGMSMGSASASMITGPAAKITDFGALKIVLGGKNFRLRQFPVLQ